MGIDNAYNHITQAQLVDAYNQCLSHMPAALDVMALALICMSPLLTL